jgi:DNA-binding HxlR family transcriptional regulator
MKPPPPNDLLTFLQKPRAIITLLCLYHAKDEGLDMLLQKIGGSKRTGMTRINELYEMGLVTKHANEHSRKTLYQLSEDGKKIAEKLEDILVYWKERNVQRLFKVKNVER